MSKRNRYMVDCAQLILAVWNGNRKGGTYSTIKYAQKKEKQLDYIILPAQDIRNIEEYFDYVIEFNMCLEQRKEKYQVLEKLLKQDDIEETRR